ncbi:MAG: PASTA domain-containing protein [Bacteroidetes bacterium]|nr:PASTA domain-containing protein [Bacteroidota bacterium]MBK8674274.1 PASTA domain-containing protein [Bacteroidota bacterium]
MKIKEFFGKTGILGAILGMIIIVAGFLFLLNVFFVTYTMHGQTVTVPNIEGLSIKEAKNKLNNAGLEFMIADSTYKNDLPPGQVLDQSPKKGATVKKFRKIYLTVSSVSAEPVKMPNLIDNSRRQAIIILESYGLKLGKENYVPDIAKDAVRGMYLNGKEIKEGSIVLKGSVIDLDLGDGIGDTKVDVPDLLGATLMEALAVLDAYGLQPGIISTQGEITDSLSSFIYYQQPEYGTAYKLAPGDPVNLFIMQDQPDLETIQDIGAVEKSEIEEINNNQKKEGNKQ